MNFVKKNLGFWKETVWPCLLQFCLSGPDAYWPEFEICMAKEKKDLCIYTYVYTAPHHYAFKNNYFQIAKPASNEHLQK